MIFKLNSFYKHSGGQLMHMIACAESPVMWMGPTLIAESPDGRLTPCGMDETSAQNWAEIDRSEYMSSLLDKDNKDDEVTVIIGAPKSLEVAMIALKAGKKVNFDFPPEQLTIRDTLGSVRSGARIKAGLKYMRGDYRD